MSEIRAQVDEAAAEVAGEIFGKKAGEPELSQPVAREDLIICIERLILFNKVTSDILKTPSIYLAKPVQDALDLIRRSRIR